WLPKRKPQCCRTGVFYSYFGRWEGLRPQAEKLYLFICFSNLFILRKYFLFHGIWRTLTLRRPHLDQIAVRVIKAEHFLTPAMGHESVDILNRWISFFQFCRKCF